MTALVAVMVIDKMRGEDVEHGVEVSEEVTSQVMCMLFFLQAVVMQPSRLAALWLLLADYGKFLERRGYPPIRFWPMLLVFLLLNLNCWFRFVNVYYMWWYLQDPTERPLHWELSTLIASILCGVAGTAIEGWLVKRAVARTKGAGAGCKVEDPACTGQAQGQEIGNEEKVPKLQKLSSTVSSLVEEVPLLKQVVVALLGGIGLGMEGIWNVPERVKNRLRKSSSTLGGRSGSTLGAMSSEGTAVSRAGDGSSEALGCIVPEPVAKTLAPGVRVVHASIVTNCVQPQQLPAPAAAAPLHRQELPAGRPEAADASPEDIVIEHTLSL
eukprot:CAMPEP_0178451902 /NCGR_PEP_ID=MMETSP0689_2-20121128/43944_1 /TAXON_ID=160604 /ORGANISM="Amphidinium massartii, Strain CS-259" /LENGTH=325 /DNA_ID=CAMNT_0020077543 /DNA_START=128 /DNA_END=1105 /DNA_ORIENTATION=+